MKKYNTWETLHEYNDERILIRALEELKRAIGYEPTATDLLNVIWDDHLRVIAC